MQQGTRTLTLARLPVLVVLVLLVLLVDACQTSQAPAIPTDRGAGIVAQPAEVDLGHVPINQQAEAHFTVVNRTTNEVHLDQNVDVQTLEGC